jgi:hypothetical protein
VICVWLCASCVPDCGPDANFTDPKRSARRLKAKYLEEEKHIYHATHATETQIKVADLLFTIRQEVDNTIRGLRPVGDRADFMAMESMCDIASKALDVAFQEEFSD